MGYIHDSISLEGCNQLPGRCPICGASGTAFILLQPSTMKLSYYFDLFQPGWWIFTSTLPDISIAWADFFAGYALFYVFQPNEPVKSE